jgi:hypothetical protein
MSDPKPDPVEAREALAAAQAAADAGFRRAIYPRWVAMATSAWAGLLTFLILSESEWTVLVALIGIGLLLWRNHRAGATPREIGSRLDLALVVLLVLLLFGFIIGGALLAQRFGWAWAPAVIGAGAGLGLYAVMALSYGRIWTEQARDAASS